MAPETTSDLQMPELVRLGGTPLVDKRSITSLGGSCSRGESPCAPAVAARPAAAPDLVQMRFDAYELDEGNALLLRHGESLALAPTPFAVLCALARQPGALVTKGALLDAVWGHRFLSDSVLKTAISELRSALADDARQPRFIETVSRRGYRFIGVTSANAAAHSSRAEVSLAPALRVPAINGPVGSSARLEAAWARTCAGTRSIVWVVGDPGVGKTTVIDDFVASLGDIATARGQCIKPYGAGEPFFPLLEALAELCRRDSAVLPLLRAVAPAVVLQFPWLSTAQERDDLRDERATVHAYRMLRELGEFFDCYTERRPLLLVTEDLHWSDHATIQLIDHVARRRGNGRLMWLASFRVAEVAGNDPLKALRNELRLHGLCEEIVLDSFSEQEADDYLAERAPSFLADEALARGLHARTEGQVDRRLEAHWWKISA